MNVSIKYVVYELNQVMNSENHLALKRVEFSGWRSLFDSEEEAIQALIDDKKTYEDFFILKRVYITRE